MAEQKKGYIGYFGLTDWWNGLGKDLQNRIKEGYAQGIGTDPDSLDKSSIDSVSISKAHFLQGVGLENYDDLRDFDFRVSVLLMAYQVAETATDKHFSLFDLIDLYYKKRDTIPNALDLCEKYCLMDMEVAADFLAEDRVDQTLSKIIGDSSDGDLDTHSKLLHALVESQRKGESSYDFLTRMGYNVELYSKSPDIWTPDIPAFKRLAIIYEKQGKYKEAIEVCKKALFFRLGDSNNDYSKRIEKLQKKLDKENK